MAAEGVSSTVLEFGLVIVVAAVLAIFMRLIRQPPLIAYIITGIVVGPLFLNVFKSNELIDLFAHLGVTFFLFVIGLSLNFKSLKNTGKTSLTVGILQVVVTAGIGFLVAFLLGFSYTPAFYIAAALAISSTVVAINILTEKKELETLHGKISVGILIVQDFIAALILIIIPFLDASASSLISHIAIGLGLIAGVFLVSHFLMPKVIKLVARNQEILFVFSIAWAVGISALFSYLGYPVELGALVAGMSLSSSKFSLEISGKIRGIRELFVVAHLVFFGSLLTGPITGSMVLTALLFSAIILIGNPLIVMTVMRLFGHKKRTNFFTGISIAQLSELSLIIAFLGFIGGSISQDTFSLIILTALITIALSTYAMKYSRKLYKFISPIIGVFEGGGRHGLKKISKSKKYDVILLGYDRIGFNFLKALRKTKKKFLIIDFNPDTIKALDKKKIPAVYGDASDPEFLKEVNLSRAKTVISTIPDLEANINIMDNIDSKDARFIATSHKVSDTERLYDEGADYVIMPHYIEGDRLANLLKEDKFDKETLNKMSKQQLKELSKRLSEGKHHPGERDT